MEGGICMKYDAEQKSLPPAEQPEFLRAKERFDAYYQVLKLELSPVSLTLLEELLKARDKMEDCRSQYWYCKGLNKTKSREA